MNLCMAATYDPDPRAPNGFRLPFNLETGEVLSKRWDAWRKHDPVNLVRQYRSGLKSLRGIYVDCGFRDQFQCLVRMLGKQRLGSIEKLVDDGAPCTGKA